MSASDLELYGVETNTSPDPKISSDSEAETIRRVLSTLREHEKMRLQGGFNEINFTIGVLNTILIAYTFGAHPGKSSSLWVGSVPVELRKTHAGNQLTFNIISRALLAPLSRRVFCARSS